MKWHKIRSLFIVFGIILLSSLVGCGAQRAYYHEESGGRFYETTSRDILWITNRGEIVNLTSAIGTPYFIMNTGSPKRETADDSSRLIWFDYDDIKDQPTALDITSFMIGKTSWNIDTQDWNLPNYSIVEETGNCKPLLRGFYAGPKPPSPRDPSNKRHDCLHRIWEIPAISFITLFLFPAGMLVK